MKTFLASKFNSLILAFIALLGFACDEDQINRVEYGMPNADFKVNGTIVDETTQEKISNIRVVFRDAMVSSLQGDTTYSDENGNYEVTLNTYSPSNTFILMYDDVDGLDNGTYLATDSLVDFSDEEYQNGEGSWYLGEKSKEINVKLSSDESKND